MRFFTPLFISVAISFTAQAQNMVFVKDSIMDAYMRSGFANKQFPTKVNLDKNGVKNGKWEDYVVQKTFMALDDGNNSSHIIHGYFLLYEEGKYKNNNKVGTWTTWVIEDRTFKKFKQAEESYKDGRLNGEVKYFYPNGSISRYAQFAADTVTGIETTYFPDGSTKDTIQYIQQTPKSNLSYKLNAYYHSGKLKIRLTIVQDSLNGLYSTYYENGKIQQTSFFVLGKSDSIYKYYYPNGQLWTEKYYKNGLLMNVICSYDQSGVSKDKGTLVDGNGTVMLYDQDGKLYDIQYVEKGVIVKNDMKVKADPFDPRK